MHWYHDLLIEDQQKCRNNAVKIREMYWNVMIPPIENLHFRWGVYGMIPVMIPPSLISDQLRLPPEAPQEADAQILHLISIYNYIYVCTYIIYIYILWNSMNTYYIRSIVWFGYMLYTQTSRSSSGRPFGRRLGRSGSERDGYRSFAWYLGAGLNIGSLKHEMVCEHLNQNAAAT